LRRPRISKRVFITGATGFVGSHLLRHLVNSGDTVAVLIRPESDPWRIADLLNRIEPITGRLSEPAALRQPLADFKPDVVYHLGWYGSGPEGRDDPRQLTENVSDACTMVGLAADSGASAWVGLGSQAEYGPTGAVLNESTPTKPATQYGAAKLSAGKLTRDLCAERSMRHVWLRLVTAYGPADQPFYLIPHIILGLLRGKRPALTEGHQPGDYLYVADACAAIRAAGLTEECAGTYVLASGQHRPVRDVALTLRDIIDPRLEIGLGEVVPSVPPIGLRGDPRALKAVTGWAPAVPLEAGLVACVEWYRRNLRRYSKEDDG
jgi:nucleoside-diphosphate-sugar epimerase